MVFLGLPMTRAQQATTEAVRLHATPGERFTNNLLAEALRSKMTASSTNTSLVATNSVARLSTNAPQFTNTLANTRRPTNAPPLAATNFIANLATNSLRFTNLVHITNTVHFTNTQRVTDTVRVTDIIRYTNTLRFTNTERFTNTVLVTNTEHFTNTLRLTATEHFTNTVFVTNTAFLSNTVVFTNTVLAANPAPPIDAPSIATNVTAQLSANAPLVVTNQAPEFAENAIASSTNALPSTNAPLDNTSFTAQPSTNVPLVTPNIAAQSQTNTPLVTTNLTAQLSTNSAPSPELTIEIPLSTSNDQVRQLRSSLEDARRLRLMRQPATAEPILQNLLTDGNPELIQQSALLELALIAQDENNLVRAEQIYAQFVSRWSSDKRIPEIYLHQGQLFRQMGLNSLALAKFYSVMTAALALKNDQLDYYQKFVLDAQMEIAETHYQSGRFADAADFFARLLKQNSAALNRPEIQFRLIRSLQATGNHTETAAQAFDFLSRFPNSVNQPEVRFCLALALKELGRNAESLQQVLALLKEQKTQAKDHPEVWAYWQQRTGNEIANQLFREGDYPKALDIYLSLEQLDRSSAWQLPLKYQIGMTYERLLQPQMATQSYSNIVNRQVELGTNASPGLKAIVDMASWRINFIQWQSHAENINRTLVEAPTKRSTAKKSSPSTTAIP
jgi:tetratricopeptide (TPR) repeat protein